MYWVLPQCAVEYEDGMLAKEEQVLQIITDKVIETLSCYGMEMNKGEIQLIRISRQPY
jgi:hypothetical protein